MASSRSVVPAMGLLGVTGGAGAGGEVRTAVSGAGSGTRSQHAPTSTSPSITSPPPTPIPLCLLDLRATPVAHPPSFCQRLRALRSWSLAGASSSQHPLPQASLAARNSDHLQAPPTHRQSWLLCPAHLLASSLPAHLQGSLWAALSGAGLGWVRAQAREPVRLGLQAPSRHWPCPCSGSCPQAPPHWGSPLRRPSSGLAPWVMQWCLGGMVVLGAEHDLALG